MAKVSLIYASLKLIYNGVDIAGFAKNPDAALEDLWISLHTAQPKDNEQVSNEVSYPGYSRTSVPRSEIGWIVSESTVNPVGNIDFPAVKEDQNTAATHFSVGTDREGSGWILHSGPIDPNIPLKRNSIPRLNQDTSITIVQASTVPNISTLTN